MLVFCIFVCILNALSNIYAVFNFFVERNSLHAQTFSFSLLIVVVLLRPYLKGSPKSLRFGGQAAFVRSLVFDLYILISTLLNNGM